MHKRNCHTAQTCNVVGAYSLHRDENKFANASHRATSKELQTGIRSRNRQRTTENYLQTTRFSRRESGTIIKHETLHRSCAA